MAGLTAINQLPAAAAIVGNEVLAIVQGGVTVQAAVSAIAALSGVIPRSYLAGYGLSNDVTTPNSVLDVAAGQCADSTNTKWISLGAYSKSTAGVWVPGNGTAGMGIGLTVQPNTWYHVFAVTVNGQPDIYFDTSLTAAAAPAGTSAYRRLGSFKTDGSSHILPFVQDEDTFYWGAVVLDLNGTVIGNSPGQLFALSVPPGVKVRPIMRANIASQQILITSPDQADVLPSAVFGTAPGFNDGPPANINTATPPTLVALYTNTAQQIRARAVNAGSSLYLYTDGWVDSRGRLN